MSLTPDLGRYVKRHVHDHNDIIVGNGIFDVFKGLTREGIHALKGAVKQGSKTLATKAVGTAVVYYAGN